MSWAARMGSRLLRVLKPAGPLRAHIKQPEHLFPDSVPHSASAQMKGPESFSLRGKLQQDQRRGVVLNGRTEWFSIDGCFLDLCVMLSLFQSNPSCLVILGT